MIIFQKILSYDLRPQSGSTFEYLVDLGLQKVDPVSNHPSTLVLHTPIVLHSTLQRAAGCLKPNAYTKLVPMNELREIFFDLRAFCSPELWEQEGDVIVRRKIREFFIEDRLPEKREKIFRDIKKVLHICQTTKQGSVTVVSHSFKLKLFEAYLKTAGQVTKDPTLINNYIFDDQETFPFGATFELATPDDSL